IFFNNNERIYVTKDISLFFLEWDSAITALNAIVPANDMETGLSEVLLQVYRYGRTGLSPDFESEDYDALHALANENPKVYGDAVYIARGLLGLVIHPELDLDYEERTGDFSIEENLFLAPNPAGEYFHISGMLADDTIYHLYVKDILGKDFLHIPTYTFGNVVDIRDLAEGVYIVVVKDDKDSIFIQKLIVTK
ncbi:MAG TPA: T9SS type A sorting domain-containing protein, partial [Chitinophagales bacterium]|nr:T9SS type A sorting domain-containing protein [Chitinophagales bacterium]